MGKPLANGVHLQAGEESRGKKKKTERFMCNTVRIKQRDCREQLSALQEKPFMRASMHHLRRKAERPLNCFIASARQISEMVLQIERIRT
jgi:hypothetical protein